MNILTVRGDLLDQPVEVIVNAWNRNIIPWWLLLPQGVSGAIKRRGGLEPFRELARLGQIPLGGAVITSAGKLTFKAIIHVAGIKPVLEILQTIRPEFGTKLHETDNRKRISIGCISIDRSWFGWRR